jgi:phage shock protein E
MKTIISTGARFTAILASLLLATTLLAADPPPSPLSPSKEAGERLPYRNVDVAEFAKLREGGTNVVLDVRSTGEYKAGHIPGAINLDVNTPAFKEKVKALDRSKLYLVHCAAGVRSAKACKIMSTIQFTNLVNLEGGFRAWQKEGKPVEN